MSRASLLLAATVLLPAAGATAGEFDWPQWRGPHRDGKSG